MRILVVDDNELNRYQLQVLLSANGYTVVTASQGAEALEIARQNPPDLVITDILMPVMDGYTLGRAWMRDPRLRHVPFVFYTATYTDERDRDFALSLGARAFVVKPEEPEAFVALIRDVISQADSTAAVEPEPEAPTPAETVHEEASFLREYSDVLVHKLEDKLSQLEQAHRALQEELARRERAERERTRLLAAIERSAEPVAICDADGRVAYANAACHALHGGGAVDPVGWPLDAFCEANLGPEVGHAIRAAMHERHVWRGRASAPAADYPDRVLDVIMSPALAEGGALAGFICSAHDVTEIQALEAQLHRAQRMEALGALAGGVAHDFNNLLVVIRGQSELLQKMLPEDSPAWNRLAEVISAGDRAADLVRQLLAFSRMRVLEPCVISLNERIVSLEPMLQRLLTGDIELRTELDPRLRNVLVDPTRLDQVIVNLTVNARDAMPQGGLLCIRTENVTLPSGDPSEPLELPPGTYAVLSVRDTGTGIAPDVVARIFEPFFSTKGDRGTGLGLSTVYGVVKQSGGDTTVKTAVGAGTCMRVYLPAHSGEVSHASTGAVTPGAPAARLSATVLLAEDDVSVGQFIREALELSGCTVLQAGTGDEALGIARDHRDEIDLVLTDVVMPGIRGPELISQVRALVPDAKALCMSGYLSDTLQASGIASREFDLLEKPFSVADLLLAVRRSLAK